MKWYNYKAFSLNTALSGNAIIQTDNLQEFIENLQENKSMYHCYYDLEKRETFSGYEGIMRPVFDTIHIDLDSNDGGKAAWEDTKRLCSDLLSAGYEGSQVYFSGNKGFHVAVHKSCLGITEGPKAAVETIIKNTLFNLQKKYPTVDTGIWNANRKFRAYRSQHEKTGLYKIRLTHADIHIPSNLTIGEIRNMATRQPMHKYAHPSTGNLLSLFTASIGPNLLSSKVEDSIEMKRLGKELVNLRLANSEMSLSDKVPVISAGVKQQVAGDESIAFRNFEDKRCTASMELKLLPQFNRHDISMRLIHDYYATGLTQDKAESKMMSWGAMAFGTEESRIQETIRIVRDVYTKQADYKYGCYDEIRKAYCSAKCKLYNRLDPKLRAQPLDCSKKQLDANTESELELSEGQMADSILASLPKIVRCEGDYFTWKDTHWDRLDKDLFEKLINDACVNTYENKAPSRIIESLFRHIIKKLDVAPENNCLFKTSPNKFNFADGTCWVYEDSFGAKKLEMKPHDPKDYISYCAPFPLWADHDLPISENHEFEHYMAMKARHLGAEPVRILKQMMGAALIPYVPKIFFLIGERDSGKSTHAKLLMKLLGQKNISTIDPVRDQGQRFLWEEAVGKIANFSLELPKDTPLDTNSLKKVRDKTELDIDRKGLRKVRGRLPFLHVYCANIMPQSLEGNTGALDGRFIVVEYTSIGKEDLNGMGGFSDLSEAMWNLDAGSVLNFAREGLKDLIKHNFVYHVDAKSKEFVKEWGKSNDSVQLFLEDAISGEFSLKSADDGAEPKLEQKGPVIYNAYLRWCKETGARHALKRFNFFKELRAKYDRFERVESSIESFIESYNFPTYKNKSMGGNRFDWPWQVDGKIAGCVESGNRASKVEKPKSFDKSFDKINSLNY